MLFEDNKSTYSTREIIRQIADKDNRVKGDEIITIPCDLQELIILIPDFWDYWEKRYKVVYGQKVASEENRIRYFLEIFITRL